MTASMTCGGAFLADLILFGSMGALEALRSNGMTRNVNIYGPYNDCSCAVLMQWRWGSW